MKKFAVLLVLLLISVIGCATMEKTSKETLEQKIQYVYTFDGINKDALFKKSINWIAESYATANDVVQVKDQAQGKIIGRGLSSVQFAFAVRRWTYVIKIDIADSKTRLWFDNIRPMSNDAGVIEINPEYAEQYNMIKAKFDSIAASYETYMKANDEDL